MRNRSYLQSRGLVPRVGGEGEICFPPPAGTIGTLRLHVVNPRRIHMFSRISMMTALVLMIAGGAATARAADDVGTDAPTKRGSMVGVVVRLDDTNLIMKTKSGIEAKVATNDQTEV